eukprot:gene22460-30717_t
MNAPRVSSLESKEFVEVNIYDAAPSRRLTLIVHRNTDINSLKREIFRRSKTSIQGDWDDIENEFCDYEFFLHQSNWIVLSGSTVLGDLLSDPQRNVIELKYSPHGGVFGSIRTLIPGSVEREEKRKFLQLVDALCSSPTTTYDDMIVLSVGACTPEQIVPKFAQEACQNGKSVHIIAINPGFYHGTYSFSDNLYGYQRSSSQYQHLLAHWFEHPESDDTSTFHNFDSWQKIGERGDKFHGDFLLKDKSNIPGSLQLNCFAMCWPGVARNRVLDSDILSSIKQLIVRCALNNCYFVPIFTTGLNENEIHAEQFHSWVVEVKQNNLPTNLIVPVIDSYQRQIRFILCKNIDLATDYWRRLKGTLPHNDIVARLLPDFEPDNMAALGGKLFSTLSAININDVADFWEIPLL